MTVTEKILSILKENNIDYDFIEHEDGGTSEEMQKIRKDFSLSEGTKALIVETDNDIVQLVVPGDKKFSNSKVRKLLNSKETRFITPEKLMELTGLVPGSVPPLANLLFDIPTYYEKSILDSEKSVFNCASRTCSVSLKTKDLVELVNPKIVDIV